MAAASLALGSPPTVADEAGGCPSVAAVREALADLLPGAMLDSSDAAVVVEDRGDRYLVGVGSARREFSDPARACDERARSAAVFAAVVLAPPMLALAPRVEPAPRPRRKIALHASLELAAAVFAAPRAGNANSLVVGGGALRAFVGSTHFGGSLGAGGLSPATMRFPTATAQIERVPFDASFRTAWAWRRLEVTGDLGLAMAALEVTGEALSTRREATRIELGIHASAALHVALTGRVAAFVAIDGDFFPRSYEIEVEQIGGVGTTPHVWLGGLLGVAVRIR